MIFLLELDYYNRLNGLVETLYLTTASNFSIDGKVYIPALEVGLDFEEFLYGRGASGGVAASAVGELVIPNSDGKFDYLENCSFSGRAFRTYWAENERSLEVNLYVSGTINNAEFTIDDITFTVSDRLTSLDVNLITNKFLGTNLGMGAAGGLEGGEEIKGQNKPRIYGRCRNIQPFVINSFHLIYATNYDKDGNYAPVHSIWNVFGKGAEYLYEGDVATTEDLVTATVSASYYKTCIAEGTFRLGTVPNGDVTCDVMESFGEESSVARVVGRILSEYPEIVLDQQSLDALHATSKCPCGIYVTGEQTVLEVVKELLASIEAWMVPNYEGVVYFGNNSQSLVSPKHFIDSGRLTVKGFEKIPKSDSNGSVPSYSVTINHTKNWKVLDKGSLIDSVPEDLLGFSKLLDFFSTEYRSSVVYDNSISNLELTSKALEYNTLLQSPVYAKLRNGSFLTSFSEVVPFDWEYYTDDVLTVITITDGVCTITRGGAATYAFIRQRLDCPDQIFPGEYTLKFEVVSGTPSVKLYDGASLIFDDVVTPENGVVELTFDFTSTFAEVAIGTVSGPVSITSITLRESDKWGTPELEALKRFNIRSVPDDRYKLKLPYDLAKEINLGEQVMFKANRFNLENGEVFLVIGRGLSFPSIEVELDIWRYRDGN